MKRIIVGLAVLGYLGAAYGADWVEIAQSTSQTEWIMPARVPGEIWEMLKFSGPQVLGNTEYNKLVSLDTINCSAGSDTVIQLNYYLNGAVTYAGAANPSPQYGAPGTFEAATINAYCGTK
ncbi:hypothetical protein [Acidithiobacillus sulfuriphilus]|uniref:hypothetical protein n=1 Tax=Acidithiobacillus sulfuriphilus TaxID=1867749 RepID=UPI003F63911A